MTEREGENFIVTPAQAGVHWGLAQVIAEGGAPAWRLWLIAEDAEAEALEDALEPLAVSLARFEAKAARPGAPRLWRLEALCETEPDIAEVALRLAVAAGRTGAEVPDFHVEPLPDRDWLALNRRQFPPIGAGRFFVHGSYFDGTPPAGKVVLKLDAGPAFGSGTHETTRGCLIAIDELLAEGAPARALDVGCGSGILALAVAAAARIPVTATDIDAIAADTTRANAAANGLAGLVTARAGAGVAGIAAEDAFDLILANILAEPLIELAGELAARLAPDGNLVLSGLLSRQEGDVMPAYRAAGLARRRSIVLGEWSTLVLAREPRTHA